MDDAYSRSLREGSNGYEIEHRIVLPGTNEVRYVHERCDHERDEAGNVFKSIGMVQDVTERRLIEQKLVEKNSLLNEVLDNMLDLVAITSMDGTFLYAGRSHERLGYSVSSLIGRNVMDYVHPDDLDNVTQEFSAFVKGGEERTVGYRYRCSDGSYVWLETAGRLLKSDDDGPPRILFNSRDMTERRRDEKRLQDVQAINRALFDQALGAIYLLDLSGRIIDVNRGACSQSGYSREQLLDMTVFDLSGPDADLREASGESLLNAWKRWVPGDHHTRESVYVGKGGYRYPVLISTGAIQLGEKKAIAATVLDITERKRTEEQVRELAAEKDTLIKEIQHRVKNNISTMTSLLSLQAQTMDDPAAVAALKDARSRLESLGVLYDHLYSANPSGRGSLREYLQQLVAGEIRVFPHGYRVEVHAEIEERLCTAKILSSLGLIVNELVTNAMKYAFADHPDPELTIAGARHAERYVLTVHDNGPGILELGGSQTPSGFGLMIVDALTQQLGGTIQFENDNGTRVRLEFPVGED